ncbi:uncharacterized protein LOC144457523 [Phascolarctos cinereus]
MPPPFPLPVGISASLLLPAGPRTATVAAAQSEDGGRIRARLCCCRAGVQEPRRSQLRGMRAGERRQPSELPAKGSPPIKFLVAGWEGPHGNHEPFGRPWEENSAAERARGWHGYFLQLLWAGQVGGCGPR